MGQLDGSTEASMMNPQHALGACSTRADDLAHAADPGDVGALVIVNAGREVPFWRRRLSAFRPFSGQASLSTSNQSNTDSDGKHQSCRSGTGTGPWSGRFLRRRRTAGRQWTTLR